MQKFNYHTPSGWQEPWNFNTEFVEQRKLYLSKSSNNLKGINQVMKSSKSSDIDTHETMMKTVDDW